MRRTLHDYSPMATWHALRGTESAMAGAAAGLVSATVTCPLDVVKTKLQAGRTMQAQGSKVIGAVDVIRHIWRNEGTRGFYRGLMPTVYGYLPTWAIYFTIYDRAKAFFSRRNGADAKYLLIGNDEDLRGHILAAVVAGASSTMATNPLWVIRTRFMTQSAVDASERYRHTGDALMRIYRQEGIPGFYRGLLPSLFGVSHVCIQFPLYEHFKALNQSADGSDLPKSTILLCSSSSKMLASSITYPHEVVRTRLQVRPSDLLPGSSTATSTVTGPLRFFDEIRLTCANIHSESGLKGFYRGFSVNLVRTVPASALTILTYEVLMRNLLARTRQGESDNV